MVGLMAIDGASEPVANAIRGMLPVTLPVSSFRIDLEALRATIAQIDAVASAELRIRKGGVLQVTVAERVPAVLWRRGTALEMLDAGGHRVATLLDRTARPDLPVIAGEGAETDVAEALAILKAAEPIRARIRGLVRVGERRWDVVLDRDQRILLPGAGPVAAIQRVIALDQAEDMLGRDLTVVDMRNENRPTVRIAEPGGEGATEVETKVSGQ
jgi:cell division protein FtsQ